MLPEQIVDQQNCMRHFLHSTFYAFIGLLLLTKAALAQVEFTPSSLSYNQVFNSPTLPVSGTASLNQNSATTPGALGLYVEKTGANNPNLITANNGSSNSGGVFSYGTADQTDRALGTIGSSNAAAGNFSYGLRFRNTTGSTITSLTISYAGEQWRNSAAAAQTVTFAYLIASSVTTTSPASGSAPAGYIQVPALNFTSPVTGGTAAALDGNASANRVLLSTVLVANIPDGQEIMLRWYDPDHTGSDHGLAIDDLSVIASTNTAPVVATLSANPNSLTNFTAVQGTASAARSYTLTAGNLDEPISLSAPTGVEISTDNAIFSPSLSLPASTTQAVIFVRLTAANSGAITGTITASSGQLTANVTVSGLVSSGSGSPFTAIGTARTFPAGFSVQVAGRVTVSNQFGGNTLYIQDATGGIQLFNSATAFGNQVQLGDSVQVAGALATFQGGTEIIISSFSVVSGVPNSIPTPKIISLNQLPAYEGQLVQVLGATIGGSGDVFTSTTYPLTAGDQNGTLFIRAQTQLNGSSRPTAPTNIVGISEHFTSGNTNITELIPRILPDVPGSNTVAVVDQTCGGTFSVSLTPDQTFDLVTFNTEFFGADGGVITCPTSPTSRPYPDNGPTNETLQAQNVATVLNRLNADVMVLEEVSNQPLLAQVVSNSMSGYSLVCSDRFSYYFQADCDQAVESDGTVFGPSSLAQKVCVVYKNSTVNFLANESRALFDGRYNYPNANNWSSGRLPYLFAANVTINGATQKVYIVGIHAKSGSATADYQRRQQDILELKTELDTNYPNANVIIAGDYNDQILTSIATGQPSTYRPFDVLDNGADNPNYEILTKPLEAQGCRSFGSGSFLDHITVSNELLPAYIPGSALVFLPGIQNYGNTTSDHFPVLARFDLSKLSTPPTGGSLALVEPLYNCDTRQLTFQSSGSNGSPVEYMAIGVRGWSTNPIAFIEAPVVADPNSSTILLMARQNGVEVSRVFNFRQFCNSGGGNPPTQPGSLSLLAPLYNCATRQITFQAIAPSAVAIPIEFRAIGVRDWSANPVAFIEAPVVADPNNATILMEARQGDVYTTRVFNFRQACGSAREAVNANENLKVTVLGNPTQAEVVEVTIEGAQGEALRLSLTDAQGRNISEQTIEKAGALERQFIRLGRSVGVYFLAVKANGKSRVIRLVRQ